MNMMTTIIARPLPPIALLRALPPGPLAKEHLRLQRLAELFATFDRDDMEAGVELLLAELDAQDGDSDLDTGGAEDEPLTGEAAMAEWAPGCEIGDVPEHDGIGQGDLSWTEWQTRGRHQLERFGGEIVGRDRHRNLLREDDEEDDAPEAMGDEHDTGNAEDEELFGVRASPSDWYAGCAISDPPESTLGAPEQNAGNWRWNMGTREDGECESWEQPPTMDGPMPANDRVPA